MHKSFDKRYNTIQSADELCWGLAKGLLLAELALVNHCCSCWSLQAIPQARCNRTKHLHMCIIVMSAVSRAAVA